MRLALALLLAVGAVALPAGIEGINRIQDRQVRSLPL